ncbi:MAG: aldolase [Terracidiphilus sp.]
MESTLPALAVQCLDLPSVEQLKAAVARGESISSADPMLARAELPLQQMFYPFGFPLQLLTNSPEILSIAGDCWHGFHPLFDMAPIRFQVGVTQGGPAKCPPAPSSRVREHICSHVADSQNFAISDAAHAFTVAWFSETTLAHRDYIRYFMLESAAMFHLAARYAIGIHAACVASLGRGILLSGDSGAGKSTLAYACARAGFTYVTDDASFLVNSREDSLIVGNSRMVRFRPSAESLFPELRGRPMLRRAQTGKPSIEWPTASLAHIATAFSTPVLHTVFLNRQPGLPQQLIPFPSDVARAFILQRGIGIASVASLHTDAVDRLLTRGLFELCYTDLDWAVVRLARLAQDGF